MHASNSSLWLKWLSGSGAGIIMMNYCRSSLPTTFATHGHGVAAQTPSAAGVVRIERQHTGQAGRFVVVQELFDVRGFWVGIGHEKSSVWAFRAPLGEPDERADTIKTFYSTL